MSVAASGILAEPAIAVGTFPDGLLVNPICLDPDEDGVVASRLQAVLSDR